MFTFFKNEFHEIRHKIQGKRILEDYSNALLPYPFFLTLVICSSVIATIGVLEGNIPITIGAMIIAPLVAPIVGVALGIVSQEKKIIVKSFIYGLTGILLFLLIGFVISFFYSKIIIDELLVFLPATIGVPEAVVAIASGLVAAMAFASEKLFSRISGAAISLALAPPLVLVGISVSLKQYDVAMLAAELTLVNILGLIAMSLLVFQFIGFKDKEVQ